MALYDFLVRAPEGKHVVHFFDDEKAMMETVCLYALAGLRQGEGVLLIGSPSRLDALCGYHAFKTSEQLILLDAKETLSKIHINGTISEERFKKTIIEPIK